MKNWNYQDITAELNKVGKPTKDYVNDKEQNALFYYLASNGKAVKYGDKLEIKYCSGRYGATTTIVGTLVSIDSFGRFKMKLSDGTKPYIYASSDLDFDLIFENSITKIMVFRTTTKHGFGAMDVHAHDTYVKILSE